MQYDSTSQSKYSQGQTKKKQQKYQTMSPADSKKQAGSD
jgi:hypothetical protein